MDASMRSARTRGFGVLVLVFGLLLIGAEANAQNLLANSTFDSSLAGWNTQGSGSAADGARTFAPFPDDVTGVPTSGSARLDITASAAPGTQIGLSQCVAVTAGQAYNYGSRVKFPTGQTAAAARAFIEIEFFANLGCGLVQDLGEGQGALIGTAYVPDDLVWRALPGTVPSTPGQVVAPSGTQSAQVRILVERAVVAQAAQALFDNPFFGIGVLPVELQQFEIE